jgi:hypothetical protein
MVVEELATRGVQVLGNPLCCQPMPDDVTGPGTGTVVSDGAVHEMAPVCAPYHVGAPSAFQTNQQVPLEDRSAIVTLPPAVVPDPPSTFVPSTPLVLAVPPVNVTLTVEAFVEGPETNEVEGSDADNVEISTDPKPPVLAAADPTAASPDERACWATRLSA